MATTEATSVRGGALEMHRLLDAWCASHGLSRDLLTLRHLKGRCPRRACVQVHLVAELPGRRVEIWETQGDGISALAAALERLGRRLGSPRQLAVA